MGAGLIGFYDDCYYSAQENCAFRLDGLFFCSSLLFLRASLAARRNRRMWFFFGSFACGFFDLCYILWISSWESCHPRSSSVLGISPYILHRKGGVVHGFARQHFLIGQLFAALDFVRRKTLRKVGGFPALSAFAHTCRYRPLVSRVGMLL